MLKNNSDDGTPRTPQTKMILQNTPSDVMPNPDIKHLLSFYIDFPSKIHLAESLLEYFRNREDIRYDAQGNLFQPIKSLNILNVIQYLILNKISNNTEVDTIKSFIKLINLPEEYINHKDSRKVLFGENKPLKSKIPIKRDSTLRKAISVENVSSFSRESRSSPSDYDLFRPEKTILPRASKRKKLATSYAPYF